MILEGKTVLVTGSDGFIGSHLVERLLLEGCTVRAFVYYNAFNSWGWLEALPAASLAAVEIFAGDVRDPNGARTALEGIDVVFHLAALIGIPFSYHSPDSYVDTNVKGTLNVLNAARSLPVERVVVTSTSEVYGTARRAPIDESHPLQPQSPYAASKIAADALAISFHDTFDTPVVVARPFNTYGPRQSARAVIPTIISQVVSGSRRIRLGALHPTRDFNYVQDTCAGLVALARCDEALGMAVNIGSGHEISIGKLAERIIALMGAEAQVVADEERKRPERSEVDRLLCDSGLIQRLCGWRPEVVLEEGLRRTIEWFRQPGTLNHYKPHVYNV